jgi:hypothetical protein
MSPVKAIDSYYLAGDGRLFDGFIGRKTSSRLARAQPTPAASLKRRFDP